MSASMTRKSEESGFSLDLARQHFKRGGRDMEPADEAYYLEGWNRFSETEWHKPKEVGCDFNLAESLMYAGLLERKENHRNGYRAWFRKAKEAA